MKIWVINELFRIFFGHYYYPFETANEKYYKLSKEEQLVYNASIDVWTKSKAFKNEHEEMIRAFYSKLALEANDEILIAAYRMTMIFMRDYEKRLKSFSKLIK